MTWISCFVQVHSIQCIKNTIHTCRKVPFKQCLCDMCLNNSLLIALLVANGVKGISRKITQNVLDSYCSQELKQQCTSIHLLVNFKRRLDDCKDLTITDCHRECIF